jgi:hypothetical protein
MWFAMLILGLIGFGLMFGVVLLIRQDNGGAV